MAFTASESLATAYDHSLSRAPDERRASDIVSRVATDAERGLFIVLISVHGLIRGEDPELGRDADTGGQVQYVLDLARSLSRHPKVERVELMTRQILSTNVDHQYGQHLEQLREKAWIVRLPCGPHRYLRKESLWPHLPQFVDNALLHFREIGLVPDVVHGHYPDAGVVALRLGNLLGAPVLYTGHSLGRVKRQRLIDKGVSEETIEKRYKISRRIQAEESAIDGADLIIASTQQEASEQYGMYTARADERMVVIAPGVNLDRFRPPRRGERLEVAEKIDCFLSDPRKPIILAVQRPDERKNLVNLIRAYGEDEELRSIANLVLMIGTRENIQELGTAQRKVLTEMLLLVDLYDLYGSVAYPKSHTPEDIAELYRLAARRRGVFVNPALTEPFGLTLIEAAASGLPVVSTNDGGPQEIVRLCKNGILVDPLEPREIADALLEVLSDRESWRRRSRTGARGADAHFSWKGHVKRYLRQIEDVQRRRQKQFAIPPARMLLADRLIVCDIDNTLTGNRAALADFLAWLEEHRHRVAFGIATGRVLQRTMEALEEWEIPLPDVLITAVGSEIFYGRGLPVEDLGWRHRIDHSWDPSRIRKCLRELSGLRLQPKKDQRDFKLSYFVDPDVWPGNGRLRSLLKDHGLRASIVYSHQEFLDVLPNRASKGRAVKYVAERWGFSPDRVVVAGDSGNDAAMLRGVGRGVVVGNYSPELRSLRGREDIYFAQAEHARGVLEGIEQFDFLTPDDAAAEPSTNSKGDSR
jgi:sucrose-phosphate synthase